MVKSIVRPYILCVLGYIGMPGVSMCQSHSVSACTSICLCRARTCAHRKPRCCYSNYFSMLVFLIEKYVVEGEKLSTHKVLYTAPESIAARRRPFYQTLHASLTVPAVSSTSRANPPGSWRLPEIVAIFASLASVVIQSNS